MVVVVVEVVTPHSDKDTFFKWRGQDITFHAFTFGNRVQKCSKLKKKLCMPKKDSLVRYKIRDFELNYLI